MRVVYQPPNVKWEPKQKKAHEGLGVPFVGTKLSLITQGAALERPTSTSDRARRRLAIEISTRTYRGLEHFLPKRSKTFKKERNHLEPRTVIDYKSSDQWPWNWQFDHFIYIQINSFATFSSFFDVFWSSDTKKGVLMISTNANQSITGPSTCTTLLRRVQADKREAWAIFEAIYHPLIFRWCRRAIPRWQDAEEVAQNVLLAVVKDITKMRYEEPTDTLRGWLRRITQRQLANYFRNDDHRKVGVGGSDFQLLVSNSATTEDEDQEERAILVRSAFELALKGCGAQTREIFWRTMYYQEPPRQVADALGVSIQVVYLAQSRVRGMIRERCVGLVDLDEILGAAE